MKFRAGKNTGLYSNRNFRNYFAARIISQLGDQMYVFAVGWYVMDMTRSSFHMAALLAVNSLMVMAVSPFGGLVSDRVSRKKVMVATDLIQGAVLLALIVVLRGRLSIGALFSAAVILGLCSAVFSPAAGAILPGVVGRELVPAAVAAGQVAENLCTIAGMVSGGILYKLIGIYGILALNASSNILAAVMESRIQTAPLLLSAAAGERAGAFKRFAADIRDGLRFVRSDGMVVSFLLINTVFALVVLPIPIVYLPYFFNVVLGASPGQAAFAQAGIWVGVILGCAAAARVLRRHRAESIMAVGLLAISATTFILVPIFWARVLLSVRELSIICALSNAMAGASAAFFSVPLYALYHARGREEFRGRFWGFEVSLRTAATCGGFFMAGILAQRLPLGTIFGGTAVLMFLMCLWAQGMKSTPAPMPQS